MLSPRVAFFLARPGAWAPAFFLGLLLVLVLAGVFLETRPRALPEPALSAKSDFRVQCVSYAPFRRPGHSPFIPGFQISREAIEDDLRALSHVSACVRTYSVDQGLDQVPDIARALGMRVLLGAWVGRETEKNIVEVDKAVALANAYPDVVERVIVGNEVLLRQDQPAHALKALLQRARATSTRPITYADVWEFWLRHQEALIDEVDLVTVHILPFWEDHPVAIDKAAVHVGEVMDAVQKALPKPVVIGETGWPSEGRQRALSKPSLLNQAHYIRAFTALAHERGWEYNLIEGIDQPWKRQLEGTVGGFWGLMSADLEAKFPYQGPMAERERFWPFMAAIGIAILLTGGLRRTLAFTQPETVPTTLAWVFMAALIGVFGLLHYEQAVAAYRTPMEWGILGSVWLLGALLALLCSLQHGHSAPLPSLDAVVRAVRQEGLMAFQGPQGRTNATVLLLALLLFCLTAAALFLAIDPRYRDFPTLLYALPALSAVIWGPLKTHNTRLERRFVFILVVALCLRVITEPENLQALAWLGTGLLFAFGYLAPKLAPDLQERPN
jgi:exo-beta-1,3-glucanase (GH17 family)